ncbi:hypothetical protein HPB47_016509 [Ixodes persulcatus]|uniref:Uncharacterized protein n=1 Tax=Ixodes persulcatus TaxID=34615 RepID=A0AC60QQQ4_IXOPE|nr:hypothetical protein HPB47_016509 [Ixodes persulcatus]
MVQAIIDSGAEISVVRDGVVPEMKRSSGGVTLTGAFGDSVSAVLRHLPMTLPRSDVDYDPREVSPLCGVTEQLVNGIDMLLTPDDYDSLKLACGRADFEPVDKLCVVAFMDMGHAALQVVLVAFNKDRLKILATTFDGVGGHDSDMVLVRYFVQEFKERYKLDVATNRWALIRLITECEKLKKQISPNPHDLPLNIHCYKIDRGVAGKMERETFEAIFTELLAPVKVAGLRPPDVELVDRVGGGTRVPAVKQLVRKVFQREPSTILHQDEAVARSGVRQCVMLSPIFKVRDFAVVDAQPYPMELCYDPGKGKDRQAEALPRWHQLPFSKMLIFSRSKFQPRGQLGSFTGNKVVSAAEGGASKIKVKVRLHLRGIFSEVKTVQASAGRANDGDLGVAGAASGNKSPPTEGGDPEKVAEVEPVKKEDRPSPKMKQGMDTELPVEVRVPQLSAFEINQLSERQVQMVHTNRIEKEWVNAKNAVEKRNHLSDRYQPFVVPSKKEAFRRALDETRGCTPTARRVTTAC